MSSSRSVARLPTSSAITNSSRLSTQHLTLPCTLHQRSFSTTRTTQQEQQAEEDEKKEMDDGEKNIHDILTREFQPSMLQVQDSSGGCGSFYSIVIASSHFNGKPTVKAHRMVNEALKDVISGIHGLQLRTMPVKN